MSIRDAVTVESRCSGGRALGALRAAEVSSVVGVGRIFEMYRTGIERDDEVAVLVDPEPARL